MPPRQKNLYGGHDCSRIGSQRLLHKNLFRKVPLFVSQYRFSFRKVQISISQSTDFVSFRVAKYNKPLLSNIHNAATLASGTKSLLALSNPVIFYCCTCRICEMFTWRRPKSDICHACRVFPKLRFHCRFACGNFHRQREMSIHNTVSFHCHLLNVH